MQHPQGAGTPSQSQIRTNIMQYTKSMIDQVFLIRKIVPTPIRPHVKLTNPNLLEILAGVYRDVEDLLLRDLIHQLMTMAGPAWLSQLHEPHPNQHQQVYRGHVRAAAVPANAPATKPHTDAKAKLVIYRGQTVPLAS